MNQNLLLNVADAVEQYYSSLNTIAVKWLDVHSNSLQSLKDPTVDTMISNYQSRRLTALDTAEDFILHVMSQIDPISEHGQSYVSVFGDWINSSMTFAREWFFKNQDVIRDASNYLPDVRRVLSGTVEDAESAPSIALFFEEFLLGMSNGKVKNLFGDNFAVGVA